MKVLRPELDRDPHALRRFRDEGLAASRLQHPNIVRIVEHGQGGSDEPFLAMELISGEPLGHILRREGGLAIPRAIGLAVQLLEALGEAHRCGVTHADVTSDNILVTQERGGRELATLIDFGLACVDEHPRTLRSATFLLSGTPAYIAPELVAGHPPTACSDLYSAAAVLYELLTGDTPFGHGNALVVLNRHVTDPAVAPSRRCPAAQISARLDAVVLRGLSKDPADRFATAREFSLALLAGEDTTSLAYSYLERASALIGKHRLAAALDELVEGIRVVSRGEDILHATAASLWRLLLSAAAVRSGLGDVGGARADAELALVHAARVGSRIGCGRASRLLARLKR